jgi:hypothetical protein
MPDNPARFAEMPLACASTLDYAGKDADDRGDPTTGIGEGGAAGSQD